jgi:hypothetical protein
MSYGNITVIFMVVAVVACVVGLACVGTYFLNRVANRGERAAGSASDNMTAKGG